MSSEPLRQRNRSRGTAVRSPAGSWRLEVGTLIDLGRGNPMKTNARRQAVCRAVRSVRRAQQSCRALLSIALALSVYWTVASYSTVHSRGDLARRYHACRATHAADL